MTKRSARPSRLWYLGLGLIYFGLLCLFNSRFPAIDTDLPYHQAISRIWNAGGLIRSLPQVEDLNWGSYFIEKEFLFHAVTALGYWLGGDEGVRWVVHSIAFAWLGLLFYLAQLFVSRRQAFFLTLLLILSIPYFSMRFMLARPHVLAMLFFLVVLTGLIKKCGWKTALGSALFALAYHAFYIPLILLVVWWGAGLKIKRGQPIWKNSPDTKIVLWGLAGLVLGIILNPYFPSNIAIGWDHFRFIFYSYGHSNGYSAGHSYGAGDSIAVGEELRPLPVAEFVFSFLPHLAVLFWSLAIWLELPKNTAAEVTLRRLLLLSVIYLIGSLIIPRTTEYWIPLTFLTFAVALVHQPQFLQIQIVALGILSYLPISFLLWQLRSAPDLRYLSRYSQALEVLKYIPREELSKKIINTSFGVGEYILYARPDLRFVDVLDPLLLRSSSPVKFKLLTDFKLGLIPDAYYMLKDVFSADYVISDVDIVSRQLAHDPRFLELGEPDRYYRVFKLYAEFSDVFVTAFRDERGKRWVTHSMPSADRRSAFLDLNQVADKSGCALLFPESAELAIKRGATAFAIGFLGSSVEVRVNHRPWYRLESPHQNLELLHRMIDLAHPLSSTDQIEIRICGDLKQRLGISFSLWGTDQRAKFCRINDEDSVPWRYEETSRICH